MQLPSQTDSNAEPLCNRLIVAITDQPDTEQCLRNVANQTGMLLRLCSKQSELDALIELAVPEAILIDLNLSDLNGWKIYRSLKSQPSMREVPALLADLDCRSQDQDPEEIERLPKPVQPEHLRKLIQQKCPSDRALGVLVVEDDADDRALLTGLLREMGHHPIEAEDGVLALSLARQTFPDLVLLDIGLPYKSGLDVLAELRAQDKLSDIPVIVVSRSQHADSATTPLSMHHDDLLFRAAVHPMLAVERVAQIFGQPKQS